MIESCVAPVVVNVLSPPQTTALPGSWPWGFGSLAHTW